ncbi:hypothetical protein QF019_002866 [Pseudomonas frederiksbergensis]|jgi:hypothetical protein
MEVRQVYVAPFIVSGLKVRTRNSGPESVAVHIGIV